MAPLLSRLAAAERSSRFSSADPDNYRCARRRSVSHITDSTSACQLPWLVATHMYAAVLNANRGAVLLAIVTYVTVFGAALMTGSDMGGLNAGAEGVSSSAGTGLGGLANVLPLGYAFGAGMVAAVNPCGFALLPAYLALFIGGRDADGTVPPGAVRLARAARVGLTVSAGFTLLFAAAGLLLGVAATAVVRVFPLVGLAVGVGLVAVGARLIGGATVYAGLGERIADRLGQRAQQSGTRGYFLYGVAYGAASLSCTLPIFLAVVGTAF